MLSTLLITLRSGYYYHKFYHVTEQNDSDWHYTPCSPAILLLAVVTFKSTNQSQGRYGLLLRAAPLMAGKYELTVRCHTDSYTVQPGSAIIACLFGMHASV